MPELGAFAGLLIGMGAVAVADRATELAWLWLNPLGCLATVITGLLVSAFRARAGPKS